MVPRCCPIGPCRRKYDLSRAGVGSVPGRPVGSRGDPDVPPGFAGVVGWRPAVVAGALSAGICPRSKPASGSRNCRCKTPTRNPASGRTTAVTPLLWPSHPSRVWTTALFRGTPAMLWLCPLTGAAIKKPRSLLRSGFPLFHFRPCLAGASANRSVEEDLICRYRCLSEKPRVPVRACTESIFFTSTRSPL